MASLAEWIKNQEGVKSAVAYNDHVDIVYVNGSTGSVEVYDQTLYDDFEFGNRLMAPPAKQGKGNLVGNQEVFIYDAFPYVFPDIDEADSIKTLFEESGFYVNHVREEKCTIDTIESMFQYGYVQFITHGRTDAIATGEIVTPSKLEEYQESMDEEHDLIRQYNLIIKTENGLTYEDDFFCVTDRYISGLQGQFDEAVVFNAACEGFVENSPLAEAFLSHGVVSYWGFNNETPRNYSCAVSQSLVIYLLEGHNVGEIYDYMRSLNQCHDFDVNDINDQFLYVLTTCFEMDGSPEITWYDAPPGPAPGTPEFVDLGLPSGTLWATCNVGANASEEYGDYFAWGETEPKAVYNAGNYRYCNGSENALTKYCNDAGHGYNGFTDNLTTLLPEDDAATANWGNNWRTPTEAEWQELLNNTSITWTAQNGVNGRLFTASNGNSLFMPAAGFTSESGLNLDNYGGRYWSSSLELDNPSNAWNNSFYSGDYGMDSGRRAAGRSVRPVRATSQVTSYVVNATPSPTEGGSIRISGGSQSGTTCTLTATANEGYVFTNWTENGSVVSTLATYSFTLTGNRTLVANFTATPVNYTVSVSTNPTSGGSVTGGGTYQQGQFCTVTASANSGYTFTNWTENGMVVSTEATYSFMVTDNRMLVANFALNSIGGHEYVDLGLPSGTLWATCNVGANAPEEFGDYFAWGEIHPKENYSWNTYQYSYGNTRALTKYCNNSNHGYNGFTDNLTTLLPEDDAAAANWGADWRMPTLDEVVELFRNTNHKSVTYKGMRGMTFTGANGNSIFIPNASCYHGSEFVSGTIALGVFYWTSSLYEGWDYQARYLADGFMGNIVGVDDRSYGLTVRPVRSNR